MIAPRKLLGSALWAVLRAAIRCFALSSLVGVHVTAQQVPVPPPTAAQAADAVAAHIKLSGFIRTPSGVLVPGATVNLLHTETGQAWVTWTDDKGKFELPGLPIGHYRFTVEQLGFDKTVFESDVSVGTKPTEMTLKVAAVTPVMAATAPPAAPMPAVEKPAETKTADAPKPAETKPADTKAAAARPAGPGGQRGPGAGAGAGAGGRNLTPQQLAAMRQQRAAPGGVGGPAGPGGFRQVETTQTSDLQADPTGQGLTGDTGPLGDTASSDAFVMNGTVGRGTTSGADMNMFQMMGPGGMGGPGGPGGMDGMGGQTGSNPFGAGSGAQALGGGPGFAGGGPGGGGGAPGGGRGGAGGAPGGGRGGAGAAGRGGQQRGGRGGMGPGGPATAESLWGAQRLSRMAASRVRWTLTDRYDNSALAAEPYSLTNANPAKLSTYHNSGGVSMGGPLVIPKLFNGHEKTLFFLNYQFRRSRTGNNVFSTVPTQAERGGDFSALNAQLYVPGATITGPRTAVGSVIPSALISPAAAGLMAYIPLPNLPGTVQNYYFQARTPNSTDNLNLRLVQTLTPKLNLAGVYNYSSSRNRGYNGFPSLTSNSSSLGQSASLTLGQTLSRTLVHSTAINWNRSSINTLNGYAFQTDIESKLGIGGVSNAPINYGLPTVSFTNFTGINDTLPNISHNQQVRFTDSLTVVKAKHTLRVGMEFRKNQNNKLTQPLARGSYTFSGALTSQLGPTGLPVAGTGLDFADFLLGLPYSTNEKFGTSATYLRYWGAIGYVQDDWRPLPRLSLNFGLRYELLPPWNELNGHMANLDINSAFTQAQVYTAGQAAPFSGSVGNGLIRPDYNNFAPRFGLAWRPPLKKSTTVRAGYSWFYNSSAYSQVSNALLNQPPFSQAQLRYTSDSQILTLANGFPAAPPGSVLNTVAVDPNYRVGYAQIWNAGIETQIIRNMTLEAVYTGTKGTRLDLLRSPNVTVGTGLNAARLIPTAAAFSYDQSNASSIYHAMQLRLTRRMSKGFMINGSYTFGKSIDDASSLNGGNQVGVMNDKNFRGERGLSSFDVRHQLRFNYNYELPFGERKTFLNHGKIASVTGNWALSGSTSLQTGTPATIRLLGSTSNNSGSGNNFAERPNEIANPNLSASDRSALAFFNTAAFAIPAAGTYGNAGRNTVIGPGSFTTNLALSKGIRMGKDQQRRLDIRFETNNVFNHPNFSGLNTSFGSITFGRVQGAQSMRTADVNLRFSF